jgi:RNA polymerase sigma factor (TIGR02999 family)
MLTPSRAPEAVTQLLLAWSNGDREALDRLMPLVYDELRRLARRYMRRERVGHTLQTTAVINEAYLKLVDQQHVRWQNRAHFYAISAQLMRRILVDHARRHAYAKRGGGALRVSLDETVMAAPEQTADVVAVHEALERLAEIDERKSRVVELRFFGGLSIEETAEVVGVTPMTVTRDWKTAKAWLHREISREA